MRFRLCEEADTILYEDDISQKAAMTKAATQFSALAQKLEKLAQTLKDTGIGALFAGQNTNTASDIAKSLREICGQANSAAVAHQDRSNEWDNWLNAVREQVEDLSSAGEQTRKNVVTSGEKKINKLAGDAKKQGFTPKKFKEQIEATDSAIEGAKILYDHIVKNSDDGSDSEGLMRALVGYAQALKRVLESNKICYDLEQQIKSMQDDLKGLFGDEEENKKQKNNDDLDKVSDESSKDGVHKKKAGKSDEEHVGIAVAKIRRGKWDQADEDLVANYLATHCSGANDLSDIKSLMQLIVRSIQRAGTSKDNFMLNFILNSKYRLGDIGSEALGMLYRYWLTERGEVTALNTGTVSEDNTPWLYSKAYYDQFPKYEDFRNATQSFELMRDPKRVADFFGMRHNEDQNGTKIDQNRLIASGKTPENIKVKPLNTINAIINKLRSQSRVTAEDQADMVQGKPNKEDGMRARGSRSDRGGEGKSFDASSKLSDTEINAAAGHVKTIDKYKDEIAKLPQELQAAIKAGRKLLNAV